MSSTIKGFGSGDHSRKQGIGKEKQVPICSKCHKYPLYTLDDTNPELVREYCPSCQTRTNLKLKDILNQILLIGKDYPENKCECSEHKGDILNAVSFCLDCEIWICQKCQLVHSNKGHFFQTNSNIVSEKCFYHNKQYEQYCHICELNICSECVVEHQEHQEHLQSLQGVLDAKNLATYIQYIKSLRNHIRQVTQLYQKIKRELDIYRESIAKAYEKTNEINLNIIEMYETFVGFAGKYKNNYYVLKNIKEFCQFSFKKFKIDNHEDIYFNELTAKDLIEFEYYLKNSSLIVHKCTNNLEELQRLSDFQCSNFISSAAYYKHQGEDQKDLLIAGFVDGTIGIVDVNDPKKKINKIKINFHNGPVVSLFINKEYVYSGSVDTFIHKWKIIIKPSSISLVFRVRYKGHSGDVNRIIKMEGFDNIISCSSDKRIIIWNTKVNEKQFDIEMKKDISLPCPVVSIINTVNTNHLVAATVNNELSVYDIISKRQLSQMDNIVCNYSNCLIKRDDDIIVGGNKFITVIKVNREGEMNEIFKFDLSVQMFNKMEFTKNMVTMILEGDNDILFTNAKHRIYKFNMSNCKVQFKELSRQGRIDHFVVIGGNRIVVVCGKYVEILGS